jgi:hypothetical protein
VLSAIGLPCPHAVSWLVGEPFVDVLERTFDHRGTSEGQGSAVEDALRAAIEEIDGLNGPCGEKMITRPPRHGTDEDLPPLGPF